MLRDGSFSIEIDGENVKIETNCVICRQTCIILVKYKDFEKYQLRQGYIQDIFSYLSAEEREILISGVCGTCFDKMFQLDDQ